MDLFLYDRDLLHQRVNTLIRRKASQKPHALSRISQYLSTQKADFIHNFYNVTVLTTVHYSSLEMPQQKSKQ